MSYAQELAAAHAARVVRLSRRAPAAGPLVLKPRPIIIPLDREGRRLRPPALPNFPPLPALPSMPAALAANRVSVAQVIHVVAEAFDLSVPTLLDHKMRLRHICRPRQVAMYIARLMISGISLLTIGRRMGGFDHTTVLYAIDIVPQRMAADAELLAKVEQIQQTLLGVAASSTEAAATA